MDRKFRSFAAAGALALALTGLPATTAAAAPLAATTDGATLSVTGAKGTTTLTWISAYEARPVDMRVYDTGCDGKAAYVYFTVHARGATWNTDKRWNKNGCQTDVSYHSYIHDGRGILNVQFHVCRDGGSCTSTYLYNSYPA